MKIRLNKSFLFLLLFFFSAFFSFANIKVHRNVVKIVDEIDLNDYFKCKIGDDPAFANLDYNDSTWEKLDDDSLNKFFKNKSISWYRVELQDTGLFALEPLAIQIQTTGAVELFLNGIKIDSVGKIPTHDEKVISGFSVMPTFTPIKLVRGQKNILAIRFKGIKNEEANNHGINFTSNGNFVHASLTTTRLAVKQMMDESRSTQVPLFFSGAFIVLSVFHFMLFFYYRKNRTNLYYALFTFFIFIVFFCIYKITSDADIETVKIISRYLVVAFCMIPLFFIGILYEVFYKKLLLVFWILFALLATALFTMFILDFSNPAAVLLMMYIIFCLAETIRVFIRAWVKKKDGAGIFLFGVLFPLMGVILMGIIGSMLRKWGYHQAAELLTENRGAFFGVGMLMSMSISMTIYLSRDFSRMNNKLHLQITEIKQLFDKTIEQETERKNILENQKSELERMVIVRTAQVVKQKAEIEDKNRDIFDNLIYARRIQEAMLPEIKSIYESLPDSFVIYLPKDIVSGDFYTFSNRNGNIIVAAADCTGHGVTGAFMSMIGTSLLNQIINERKITQPDLILNDLNAGIIEALKQNESEINDGMDIAMCNLNLENCTAQFAGANRPLWIMRGEQLIDVKPDKFPIGGLQYKRDAVFTNHIIQLEKNDVLYLFSDGYADQFGGPDGKKLLSKRVKEKLNNIRSLPMREQEIELLNFFRHWKGHHEQVDDVLIIGIRI